jgi:DNA-binding HxlR family transcriptional regulator
MGVLAAVAAVPQRTSDFEGAAYDGGMTSRPLSVAMDLLGRRWALRIVWELKGGPLRAIELQRRCDQMSLSVLYQRLRDLTEAGLITQGDDGRYGLTRWGDSLGDALDPLDAWSRRWARTAAARR